MKKINFISLFMLLFLLNIFVVKAESCDTNEIQRLVNLANDVKIEYEIDEDAVGAFGEKIESHSYIVKISNFSTDMYIEDSTNNIWYYWRDMIDGKVSMNDYIGGNIVFKIHSKSCGVVLKTRKISMPIYNYYYEDSLCDGIDGDKLKICSEYYDTRNLIYVEFKEKVEDYLAKVEKNKKDENLFLSILNFLFLYWIYISVSVVLIIIIIVLIYLRKKRGELN